MTDTQFLALPDGTSIAYTHLPGREPGILFCSGFNSNMQGTKALALQQWARDEGRQFTRFDYFGHGQSSGRVEQGCIGRWRDDTLAVLDRVASGKQLIVGSSMAGWPLHLLGLSRPYGCGGCVGFSPPPHFTRCRGRMRWGGMGRSLATEGIAIWPNS